MVTTKTRILTRESSQVHFDDIKKQIIGLIEKKLTPLLSTYSYSDYDLQSFVQWKPIVLILGNYSAGKSTFINELIGQNIQRTGQAPTDDCFTVITHLPSSHAETVIERDGRVLLGDETLPFKRLKSQGERFLSHFRLKQVQSDLLRNVAIIDTPGMLDSISEKDRGYNYQDVIGELASLSDLVLLLFDSHKAGTVRESYLSLRNTIPRTTMEDRMLFVLNRVDECQNMDDLVRVYGALCWNLSQMTGRKDIPRIYMSYATDTKIAAIQTPEDEVLRSYLEQIRQHKTHIVEHIINVPRKRMDHLATYVEIHTHRLGIFISALIAYKKSLKTFYIFSAAVTSVLIIAGVSLSNILAWSGLFPFSQPSNMTFSPSDIFMTTTIAITCLVGFALLRFGLKMALQHHQKKFFANIKEHLDLESQYDQDHYHEVLPLIQNMITQKNKQRAASATTTGLPPIKEMARHHKDLKQVEKEILATRKRIGNIRLASPLQSQIPTPTPMAPSSAPPPDSLATLHVPIEKPISQNAIRPIVHKQVDSLQKFHSASFATKSSSPPTNTKTLTHTHPHTHKDESTDPMPK